MRILYVEDNPTDADLARRGLLRHDPRVEVEIAATLAEARAALARRPDYELVLSDVNLPDGSGLELLAEIRERGLPLAVVILTGNGDEETAVAALKGGANDYLAKDADLVSRLPLTLAAALGRFRSESARRAGALRVLYAEPDAADVDLTRRHLEKHGPQVRLDVVDSATRALRLLPGNPGEPCPCDVLLMDYSPGGSAVEVLKILRAERHLDLPVVLVTRQGSEEAASLALRLGASDYLVKHANYLYALPATLESAHRSVLLARERAALRDSQARLAGIIDSAMDAIVSIDSSQRIVLFNPAAEAMFRCRREQAVGQPLERFIPERFRPRHRQHVEDFAQTGVTSRAMGRLATIYGRRSDAEEFPLEAAISQTRVAGDDLYTVVLRDTTERTQAEDQRRELESQLHQSQKMEAIGRLAGGVAHDFNNMLGVILGYADLAILKSSPVDPVRKSLNEIRSAALRSADLTQRLLAFSRRQTIAPRVLDLNARMQGMENLLRRLIGEDIDLELVLEESLWRVSMDPSQVDQTLANLAVNSRDAMPEGGRLTIQTRNATLDDAYCGLGLAMIFGIVKQNGGSINIYSEVGHGTTVKVYLPRHLGEMPAQEVETAAAAPTRGRELILLVEDEELLRELTRELLEQIGYKVLAAASPGEAITLFEKHGDEIGLPLTDGVMPLMSGKELAGRIQSMKPGIKLLFASGYTANAIAHRGLLEEGIDLLEKPFSLESLAKKVREVLDRR